MISSTSVRQVAKASKSEHKSRLPAAFLFRVLFLSRLLISYDFTIVDTNISGISQIVPQNEEAYTYLVDEAHLTVFSDGSAALFDESVGDFISDASYAHLCCELV